MTKKKDGGAAPKPAHQQGGVGMFNHTQSTDLKEMAAEHAKKRDKKKEKKLRKKLDRRCARRSKKKKSKKGDSSSSSASSDSSDSDSDSDSSSSSDDKKKKKKKSSTRTSKHTIRKKSKVAKLRGQVDSLKTEVSQAKEEYSLFTAGVEQKLAENAANGVDKVEITKAEYDSMKQKAQADSKPSTPVKKGIFAAVAASAASDNSGYSTVLNAMEKSLEACAKVSDLGKNGPNVILASADKVAKQASKICHQRYFSDPESLGELKDMVQRSGLGTQATHGNTIILAIIKAAISRGLDLTPDEMGLKMEGLTIE